jgi:hypothetical protein
MALETKQGDGNKADANFKEEVCETFDALGLKDSLLRGKTRDI